MRSKKLSDLADRQTICRAFRNAQWNTAGSTQKIPYDAVTYDPGGNFQLSQARYICPSDGFYDFRIGFMTGTTSSQFQPMMYKNGVFTSGSMICGSVSGGSGWIHTDVIPCKAGDYLEGYVWIGVAAIVMPANPGGQNCWMCISRIAERNL